MSVSYTFAVLIDRFKLTLDEIGELTDYQISQLYFAKRKKTGEIEVPKEKPKPKPKTEAAKKRTDWDEYFEAYQAITNLYSNKLMKKEDWHKAIGDLQAKYAHLWNKPKELPSPETKSTESADQAEARLRACLVNGIITQAQFDEAIARLRS